MELVYKTKISETGETFNNYYIVLESGYRIAIRPSFKDDYQKLRVIAKKDND